MADKELIEKIKEARNSEKRIGLVQGSWDMFHLGHLNYLKKARELCDFLIVAMDNDEKIKHRKGSKRPIIPLEERYKMIEALEIADYIVVKGLNEPHWDLIKTIRPDVLIAIKENYSDDEIKELENYCARIAILPRQATTSTSDIIRKTLISNGVRLPNKNDERITKWIEEFKLRIGAHDEMPEPLPGLIEHLKKSTDYINPVATCMNINGIWYYGVNLIDYSLPESEIENRTELFYGTVEHAEINLLKQLNNDQLKNGGVLYTTLFPCDKCMKILIDKGIKEIYYLEDHPERNWSKRSHELADRKGVKTHKIIIEPKIDKELIAKRNIILNNPDECKFIDPRNVRYKKQLDIMLQRELLGLDPFDSNIINQDILFTKNHWYVTQNKFPYEAIEQQFLIIIRKPIYNIDEMPLEAWIELKEIMDRLRRDYDIEGGAICYRFGDTKLSGASLKRLHVHIIVPKLGYKSKFNIGGNIEIKTLDLLKKEGE